MDTKNAISKLVNQAQTTCDDCLTELFFLMHQALLRSEEEVIDWYIMNDMSESDILMLIALTDTDLSVQFNDEIIILAVQYVFKRTNSRMY